MCEFCHQHGEGEKWYLQAKNYSSDLLNDLNRRNYIQDFFKKPKRLAKNIARLDDLNRLPTFVRAVVMPAIVKKQKKTHYGQVLPLEDIEKIFGFVNSIIRLPCVCRHVSVSTEQRYCYGVSMEPGEDTTMGKIIRSAGADYLNGPHTDGLETVTADEALDQLGGLEKKGIIHTVWTFMGPFIGGICNCDMDCMAMKALSKSYPSMFRAEYVAEVNLDYCTGCRSCMRACQFNAISYSLAREKVSIDPQSCYGCGVCRASCREDAIFLRNRSEVPAAANLW
ncbi:MAG: 4Fe-4S binding protein [Bacillota bacterium]